jgi:FkbM family methyltransferase
MHEFQPFNRLKACRYGQMVYNEHDVYIGRSLDLYGEFSEGECEAFRAVVKPGDVVVEVGANIGAHTLFFARQVGPSGRVLAFEPQRIVFQTLCANMALNSVQNTYCLQLAVGSQAGAIVVPQLDYAQENNYGGLSLGQWQQGDRIALVTLDSIVAGLPRCNLVKIDVEGMEREVLLGAAETIARFKPVLYVENDREEKSAELVRHIDSLGYAMYWHQPPLFSPSNFFQNPQNVFGNIISRNMLCFHRSVPHQVSGLAPVAVPN